eukprot:TRINITY_DN8456_c1_g1_i1.p1 TRINITY_DN8456_c1_g1~~TRINITY_DN8456_c1_g1_i1.p1  ORF type:complete len:999 (+),score=134.49 TRINITY_DN8456_c1_g1_i1:25-2997(+)
MKFDKIALYLSLALISYSLYVKSTDGTVVKIADPADDPQKPETTRNIASNIGVDEDEARTSTRLELLKTSNKHWTVGACGVGDGEPQRVREWLELAMLVGIGHVWVIQPESLNEALSSTLFDYQSRGYVTLLPAVQTPHPACKGVWDESECSIPKICHEHTAKYTDWWIHLSTDEFLYPTTTCSVQAALEKHCKAPSSGFNWIPWERIGTSGLQTNPKGLSSEIFLMSGGNCTTQKAEHSDTPCEPDPVKSCDECRKSKVIYTSRCLGPQHVGDLYTPVNTSAWKKAVPAESDVSVEQGASTVFLSKDCEETVQSTDNCHEGLRIAKLTGAGSDLERYLVTRPDVDASVLDLNSVLFAGLLRFVRSLRRRFVLQGYPVADHVTFEDLDHDKTCFVESGYKYSEAPGASYVELDDIATQKECCKECHRTADCSSWSLHLTDKTCKIFVGPNNLSILRTPDTEHASGVKLGSVECTIPDELPVFDSTLEVEKPSTPEPLPPVLPDDEQPAGSTKHSLLRPWKHHWRLGACGSTAVSSEWLREWIELLLIGGVDHIWMLNDNKPEQDPTTGEILLEYEALGLLTIIPLRHPKFHPGCKGMWIESDCITPKVCHEYASPFVDWFVFIDTDEFMFPTMGCDLGQHLQTHCDQNQAYHLLRWERFGTSGHYNMPAGLMTENFLTSGGDCTAHTANGFKCLKTWVHCLECKHTKVLYNTKCIGLEHVGWVHEPVNTSYWKTTHKNKFFVPRQKGFTSIYKSQTCRDTDFEKASDMCREWGENGLGGRFPPEPSIDCCSAGFGYNHYGAKSMSKWLEKMRSYTRRGFKPSNMAVIEQNTTISSGVLRFTRALHQRYKSLGLPVSPNVTFIDFTDANRNRTCFVETNWVYQPVSDLGTSWIPSPATTTESCCRACWAYTAEGARCGGWSFQVKTSECFLVHSTFNSWKEGYDLGVKRWPHSAFTADRLMNSNFTSGIPLFEGECPVPEKMKISVNNVGE